MKTLIVVILGKDVTLLILATPKLRFAISLSKEIGGRKGHEGHIFLEYGNIYAYMHIMRIYETDINVST